MKECKECGVKKDFNEFYLCKLSKSGYRVNCKACTSIYGKVYCDKNKERIRSRDKLPARKATRSAALKKTNQKNLNAYRSRSYYSYHKHKIIPPDQCRRCAYEKPLEAHHCDYNKPMEVTYLCKRCHEIWHSTNTPLNRVSGIFTEKKK